MPYKLESHSDRQRAAKQRVIGAQYDRTTRRADPALATAKRIRSSERWRQVRTMKLSQNPFCENPDARHGEMVVATEVDHIVGLRLAPAQAFVLENLMSLCHACHVRKSTNERKAFGNT